MSVTVLSCAGLCCGSTRIPAFQLRRGQAICLHLTSSTDQDRVIAVLTGEEKTPGIDLAGQVRWAEPPRIRRRFPRFFFRQRIVEWLQQAAKISEDQARDIMERLGLRPDWRIDEIPSNPRLRLALEAAWAHGADAVVFSTAGCDPLGVRDAFAAVAARLDRCSAIYLSNTYSCPGVTARDHFPGAVCLEVESRSLARVI